MANTEFTTENIINALANEIGCDTSELSEAGYTTYNNGVVITRSNGEEYAVYEDEDEARKGAIEWSKGVIEECGLPNLNVEDYLEKGWVDQLADEEADVRAEDEDFSFNSDGEARSGIEEEVRANIEDGLSSYDICIDLTDDDIAEKISSLVDTIVGKMDFDCNEEGKTVEEFKEDYREYVKNDPIEYLKQFYTEEELGKWLEDNGALDVDRMAEDCVDIDGIAHGLAGYDGVEIELENGWLAYRNN